MTTTELFEATLPLTAAVQRVRPTTLLSSCCRTSMKRRGERAPEKEVGGGENGEEGADGVGAEATDGGNRGG